MPLDTLSIDRFRNLKPARFSCSPRLNLFIGPNAAGKTSVLEALYALGRARSFRTRQLAKAIQIGASQFEIVGKVVADGGRRIPVGIRQTEKQLLARIDGRPVQRLSDLAALFPVQWLGGNLQRLIEEGPAYRRHYLDWGLFHVKPGHMGVWQRYQRLLKQRNAGLRHGRPAAEIRAWDAALTGAAEELHAYRVDYAADLAPSVQAVVEGLLGPEQGLELRYRAGWGRAVSYAEALGASLEKDRELGFTRVGPHRADLAIMIGGSPAMEQLSRGQQKLLVIGLKVAQAQLLREKTGAVSLFLVDDLGAELDKSNQCRIIELLNALGAQVFATAIDLPDVAGWELPDAKRFHVKHGMVSEMV
jgi:DNA replication and repair protein RecF